MRTHIFKHDISGENPELHKYIIDLLNRDISCYDQDFVKEQARDELAAAIWLQTRLCNGQHTDPADFAHFKELAATDKKLQNIFEKANTSLSSERTQQFRSEVQTHRGDAKADDSKKNRP